LEELNNGVVIVSNLNPKDVKTTPSFEYSNNTISNVFKKALKDFKTKEEVKSSPGTVSTDPLTV
jgi:hypothetical protein